MLLFFRGWWALGKIGENSSSFYLGISTSTSVYPSIPLSSSSSSTSTNLLNGLPHLLLPGCSIFNHLHLISAQLQTISVSNSVSKLILLISNLFTIFSSCTFWSFLFVSFKNRWCKIIVVYTKKGENSPSFYFSQTRRLLRLSRQLSMPSCGTCCSFILLILDLLEKWCMLHSILGGQNIWHLERLVS